MRSAGLVAGLIASAAVVTGVVLAQQPQPIPSFKSGVDLLVLDVSVFTGDDRHRRPVRGLVADDFTVLEDGKPQKVTAFSAIDLPDVEQPATEPAAATWVRDVVPDVQKNADSADPRLVVIVMDDSTPMRAAEIPLVKSCARRIVADLGPRDLAAVVYTLDQRRGQNYTHDRRLLLASIDSFMGSAPIGESGKGDFDEFDLLATTLYTATIGTLQGVVRDLAAIPERRKIVFFVSVGVPLTVKDTGPRQNMIGDQDKNGAIRQLFQRLPPLFADAGQANVNVYSIDPGGLRTEKPGATHVVGAANADFLKTVSARTGGAATVDTNDPGPGIAQAFRENASFYLLGYQPSNPRMDRRFRRIEVRVNRPGVTVRTREGYYEPERPNPAKAKNAPPSPVMTAIAGILPNTDIDLEATAAPFAIPGHHLSAVAIALRVKQPMPGRQSRLVENVDVAVNAYEAERGHLAATDHLKAAIALRPGEAGDVEYDVLSRLDLAPGRYQLRIGARSALSGKSGSIYLDLNVPDFSHPAVSMSSVVLSGGPAVPVAPKEKLSSLLPVVPTLTREFDTDDNVSAFFRVQQGRNGKLTPVTLTTRITDVKGNVAFTQTDVLAPDRFAKDRAADCRLQLPLGKLASGAYLLTARVESGGLSAQREVRFGVR